MAEIGSGGFLGAIGTIAAGLGNVFKAFFGISAKALLKLIEFLRNQLVEIGGHVLRAMVAIGRNLARVLRSLAQLIGGTIKRFVLWAEKKIRLLEQFLKGKFGPVLKFLARLKDEIRKIYTSYIRPIIDTIEFIRQLNAVLKAFHITVLQKLDDILQAVERRLEAPFLWIYTHITELENWVNRIVTLDGLLQRITLIRSMSHYAPAWLRIAVAARSGPLSGTEEAKRTRATAVQSTDDMLAELVAYLDGESNDTGAVIDAAVASAVELLDAISV